MTTPSYADNAPQGYMGDWSRGAPMGRGSIEPETETADALEGTAQLMEAFAARAERLQRDRPSHLSARQGGDCFKVSAWQAAADDFREQAAAFRARIPAARAMVNYAPKVTLQRIRLDSGGYDPQGAYWGIGQPLYWAATDDRQLDNTFRAYDRAAAKTHVRKSIPGARFYN